MASGGGGLGFLPSSFMLSHLETERKITDLLMTGYMLKGTARYQVLLNCKDTRFGLNCAEPHCGTTPV